MKKEKQKSTVSLWQLFITFLKVGAFTFGGGYAMIAILEEELTAKKQWITTDDMLNMVVVAESTPGVIAVNTATSVGYRLRGVLGAIIATLGVVLPSFCIIFALSFAINAVQDNVWYKAAFRGIQACVTVLIVNAFIKMSKQLNKDIFSFVLLFAAFGVAAFTRFNVIFVILIGAALGICYTLLLQAVAEKKQKELPLVQLAEGQFTSSQANIETAGEEVAGAEEDVLSASTGEENSANGEEEDTQ